MEKPNYNQFIDFFTVYYKELNQSGRRYFPDTKPHGLRFGQAFLNRFYPDMACPDLFYEENAVKAYQMIFDLNLVDLTDKE
jgi:hypothetical protein